ncbi:MAG: sulfatase-like hydrolase/transferase [Planctomycetota bacterium]|nr:sulfatase-like hydrolase/transferase [Planctomycetota bacterium]
MTRRIHSSLTRTLLVVIAVLLSSRFVIGADRPNVLLIVSDDQRPDTIAALGNKIIRTPNLDQLVREGTAFTRATCGNPICTPSRAEILSGCSSFRSGVIDFGKPINPELPLMARWFADAGYRTSYVGKWHNDGAPIERGYLRTNGLYRGGGGKWYKPQVDWVGRPVTGYRGWIFQSDDGTLFPDRGVGLTSDISEKFADAAIELLGQSSDRPFFLHVNFTAPHDPLMVHPDFADMYDAAQMPLPNNFAAKHPFDHGNFDGRDEQLFAWPRTPEETRGELAAYYAVISHMDAQIGRILKALSKSGELENTIIVFSSDHGLGLGSHGLRGKQSMYEHTIGVPLVMRGPGISQGKRLATQCYLRDLFPTLCDLVGIEGPGEKIDGRSLLPAISGKKSQVHPFVVGYFRTFQRMIRYDDWKYIEYPAANKVQLFHISEDPDELRDLSDDPARTKTRIGMAVTLHRWMKENGDPLATSE